MTRGAPLKSPCKCYMHGLRTLTATRDPWSCLFASFVSACAWIWKADGCPRIEADQLQSIFVVWTWGCGSLPEDMQRKRKSKWPHYFPPCQDSKTLAIWLQIFGSHLGFQNPKYQSTVLRFLCHSRIALFVCTQAKPDSYFSLLYTKCSYWCVPSLFHTFVHKSYHHNTNLLNIEEINKQDFIRVGTLLQKIFLKVQTTSR